MHLKELIKQPKEVIKQLKEIVMKNKLLASLVILNFTLCLIGINYGLPKLWHPDDMTYTVLKMLSGKTLNPGMFIYPSFYFYVLFFANVPYSMYLLLTGKAALAITDTAFKSDIISNVFLTSRIVTAVLGSLCIILVYLIARKVSTRRTAIISAMLASVNMAMVTYSHFATSDIPVTLLSLIALYFILILYDRPTTLNYILSGIAIGFATGTKYYAALLVLVLILAHILHNKKIVIDKKIILAGIFCLVGFFVSTPFAILDYHAFYRDTSVLFTTTKNFDNIYDPIPAFSYIFHLDNGIGTPVFLLSILGFFYCFSLVKKQAKISLLLAWAMLYYIGISITIHFSYLRYVLPIVPLLLIFAGIFADTLISVKNFRIITLPALFLLILFSLFYTARSDLLFVNDSRYSSAAWISENIPKGSKLLIFMPTRKYLPDISGFDASVYYLDLHVDNITYKTSNAIAHDIQDISPDYIIDSSFGYGRYLEFTNMYPKRSPLAKLIGYKSQAPGPTEFYNQLLDENLGYTLIKKFPEQKDDVPDPEFINPDILIFKKAG